MARGVFCAMANADTVANLARDLAALTLSVSLPGAFAHHLSTMVLVRHRIHPRGLSPHTRDKIYAKRKRDKNMWKVISQEVWNNAGERPYWKVVRKAYWKLSDQQRKKKKDKYSNCGRKKILTAPLVAWLIKKMLQLRMETPCTSGDLQGEPGGEARRASPQQQRLGEARPGEPAPSSQDWERQGQES